LRLLGVAVLVLFMAASAAAFPRPTIYGQIANTHIEDTVIFWDEIQVAYDRITLNVTAPCGDLSQVFERGETPFFDVGKLTGEVDGTYTFDLVASPTIDPSVQEALAEVRGTSEEKEVVQSLWDKGLLPRGPFRQAGFFEVERGLILPQDTQEESGAKALAPGSGLEARHPGSVGSSPDASTDGGLRNAAAGTVLTNADGVIRNSLCVGFDCPNSPTFSDTTILLMENNTRIKFDDTSTINSFPRNDWEIEANSNLNGGGSWLAINDCGQSSQGGCANDPLLLVEAGAPSNSLRIDNGGRVGLGTANPVVELHVVDGDTPTLRLDQDGSSGFAPQVWDVAGNETSFFVRDATGGSQLPFRIRPGADSNSLVIDSDNDIGIGILSPTAKLHLLANGLVRYRLENSAAGTQWDTTNDGNGDFGLSLVGSGGNELEIEQDGDIGNCGNPDHDFVISTGPGCTATPRSWIDAGDANFTTTSSRALKENLKAVEMPDILDRIRDVRVYEYDFIDGPENRLGLMAEDFYQIFHRGSDKELSGQEMQIAMWLAIQKLDARDRELADRNAEIEELKTRLEAIEEALGATNR